MQAIVAPRSAVLELAAGAILISATRLLVALPHVAPTVSAFYRTAFGGVMLLGGRVALGVWRRVRLADLAWLSMRWRTCRPH